MLFYAVIIIYARGMKRIWRYIGLGIAIIMVLVRPVAAVDESENYSALDPRILELVISAVNAGYTDSAGRAQNYDFVELYNTTGEPVALGGYELVYTNSGGSATRQTFAAGAMLNAEYLVMGYTGSPQFAEAEKDYKYGFNLSAETGTVSLLQNGEMVDEVCWGGAKCEQKFNKFTTKEVENMSLARCIVDGQIDLCVDEKWFEPRLYRPEINLHALYFTESEEAMGAAQCVGLVWSEVYAYFEDDYGEQFLELYNPTDEIVPVSGCQIEYKNKRYALDGEIEPGAYYLYQNADLKLTKNPTSTNTVGLIDANGEEVAKLTYTHGQKKGTAFAWLGEDETAQPVWRQTYALTPGEANIYQQYRSCPAGKVINPKTGNCINFFEDEVLPACPAGKFRNPETNRCRSYETAASVLAPCKDGYYRSPDTNRCRKIAAQTAIKPCAEGYERNPETNRCRKIRQNNGADYCVQPTTHTETSSFIAYGALGAVAIGGILYIIVQFRQEIGRFVRKLLTKGGKMKT